MRRVDVAPPPRWGVDAPPRGGDRAPGVPGGDLTGLYYVKNMSWLFDLRILLHTAKVMLFGRGAR